MGMAGIGKQGQPEHRFQFNGGVEKEESFGIDWHETAFRGYDAQLGRFHQIDPLADFFHGINPYQFAYNNPISYNDPWGLESEDSVKNGQQPTSPESKRPVPTETEIDEENNNEQASETIPMIFMGTKVLDIPVNRYLPGALTRGSAYLFFLSLSGDTNGEVYISGKVKEEETPKDKYEILLATKKGGKLGGHSYIGLRGPKTNIWFHQNLTGPNGDAIFTLVQGIDLKAMNILSAKNKYSLEIGQTQWVMAYKAILDLEAKGTIPYRRLTNNCVTNCRYVFRNAGIPPMPWAITPNTLESWFKSIGAKPIK